MRIKEVEESMTEICQKKWSEFLKIYKTKQVWTDGEDFIVARSFDEVREKLSEVYGITVGEDYDEGDWRKLEPSHELTIWEDVPGNNEEKKTAAEWVVETLMNDTPFLLCSHNV